MRSVVFCLATLFVLQSMVASAQEGPDARPAFHVGVGAVDITPQEEVTLAGSPAPRKTSEVATPLYARAMVVTWGDQQLAIVTLDTLKYPTQLATRARQLVAQATGIPADCVVVCASHTHSGPLWSYYPDTLAGPIVKSVRLAQQDLAPCTLGTATGRVPRVSQNRRLLIDGQAWNNWLVAREQRDKYPAAGPVDPAVDMLVVRDADEGVKAILYSFGCHPASTAQAVISADYPGYVDRRVREQLGPDAMTFFVLGPCGDVNATNSAEFVGRQVADELLRCLGKVEFCAPALSVVTRTVALPAREHSEFPEAEVVLKWKGQLEHYRKSFQQMQKRRQPSYPAYFTGIRIGDDFALVTNPVELFCEAGMRVKAGSPFERTIVATLTNGASGYVPTASAFQVGGYETWYGEHSFLAIETAALIEQASIELLQGIGPREE